VLPVRKVEAPRKAVVTGRENMAICVCSKSQSRRLETQKTEAKLLQKTSSTPSLKPTLLTSAHNINPSCVVDTPCRCVRQQCAADCKTRICPSTTLPTKTITITTMTATLARPTISPLETTAWSIAQMSLTRELVLSQGIRTRLPQSMEPPPQRLVTSYKP
jgi:hypothetical protein